MNAGAGFALVQRKFNRRPYWDESSPGRSVEDIVSDILESQIDDAQRVLWVEPAEGTVEDITKRVADDVASALNVTFGREFDVRSPDLSSASETAVEFAEAFTDWSAPRWWHEGAK